MSLIRHVSHKMKSNFKIVQIIKGYFTVEHWNVILKVVESASSGKSCRELKAIAFNTKEKSFIVTQRSIICCIERSKYLQMATLKGYNFFLTKRILLDFIIGGFLFLKSSTIGSTMNKKQNMLKMEFSYFSY